MSQIPNLDNLTFHQLNPPFWWVEHHFTYWTSSTHHFTNWTSSYLSCCFYHALPYLIHFKWDKKKNVNSPIVISTTSCIGFPELSNKLMVGKAIILLLSYTTNICIRKRKPCLILNITYKYSFLHINKLWNRFSTKENICKKILNNQSYNTEL